MLLDISSRFSLSRSILHLEQGNAAERSTNIILAAPQIDHDIDNGSDVSTSTHGKE